MDGENHTIKENTAIDNIEQKSNFKSQKIDKKNKDFDEESQKKYKSYNVKIRVADSSINRWNDEVVTLAVMYEPTEFIEDQYVNFFGAEIPLNQKIANNKTKSFENFKHLDSSSDDSNDNLDVSITEEEMDRRSVDEYKSNTFKGKSNFWLKKFIYMPLVFCLALQSLLLAYFFRRMSTVSYNKDCAYMFNLELRLETAINHLYYSTLKLESIASKIQDATED